MPIKKVTKKSEAKNYGKVRHEDFNIEKELSKFNEEAINRSLVSYANAVLKWLELITEKINEAKNVNKNIIIEIYELRDELEKINQNYSYEIIKKRNVFFEESLNFDLNGLVEYISELKEKFFDIKRRLKRTTDIEKLAEYESLKYPSFYLIAEQTTDMFLERTEKMIWFVNNKKTIKSLVTIHENWCKEYEVFITANKEAFYKKGKEEKIEKEKLDRWFNLWKKEVETLEERLLMLIKEGIEEKIDLSLIKKILGKANEYKENLKDFYLTKRISIYVNNSYKNNADFFDSIYFEKEFYHVINAFQRKIEELIFSTKKTSERLIIAKWANNWINDRIAEIIALVKSSSLAEETAKTVLREARLLEYKNFTELIRSKTKYAEQREKDFNKMQSLTHKMLKSLEERQINKEDNNSLIDKISDTVNKFFE